uniref:Peptidase A24 n=1 Tax=Caldicellulosiruptor owensensis TaxID=55205 RepID=A0A7C5V5M8_9FIRM
MSKVILSVSFLLILVVAAIYDFKKREIPNLTVVLLLFIAAVRVILNKSYSNVIIFAIYTLFFFAIYIFAERRGIYLLGEGDIKLLSVLSLYFGFDFIKVLFLACTTGFAMGLATGIKKKTYLKTYVPLAPFVFLASTLFEVVNYATFNH